MSKLQRRKIASLPGRIQRASRQPLRSRWPAEGRVGSRQFSASSKAARIQSVADIVAAGWQAVAVRGDVSRAGDANRSTPELLTRGHSRRPELLDRRVDVACASPRPWKRRRETATASARPPTMSATTVSAPALRDAGH